MKTVTRLMVCLCLPICLLTLAGCSGKEKAKEKETEDDVKFLTVMVLNYARSGDPARSIEELEPFMKKPKPDKNHDAIVSRIKSGDLVVAWGVSYEDMDRAPGGLPEQMVVYEKDAATKGGYVGMADMKVKKVTPEEFKKLKFAEKRKKKDS
jgi:hypothetical protein